MATSVKNEQIIAKEIFLPVLSEENEKRFDKLKVRLRGLLPINYIEAIKRKLPRCRRMMKHMISRQ